MAGYAVVLSVALATTLLFTPVVRLLATRFGAVVGAAVVGAWLMSGDAG